MIEINIEIEDEGTITGQLPENWDEVLVKHYEKIFEIDLSKLQPMNQYLHIISCLTDISKDVLLQLPIDEFKNLIEKIKYIYSDIPNDNVDFIEYNEQKYYLYDNFSSLNTGEVITIDMILERNENNYNKCLSDLLCLFLRKKKDNGKLEKFNTDMMSRKEDFRNLPIKQVYYLITFFLTGKK
jgi:hypothetical protein